MPGYLIHSGACNIQTRARSFMIGVEAPDILKKWLKMYGVEGTRKKYDSIKTDDMPDFSELEERVQQKEIAGRTDGMHYGVSSKPDVWFFWNSLTQQQQENKFYRGYLWHLLTDYLIYAWIKISDKLKKFKALYADNSNLDELVSKEIQKLHNDWDHINVLLVLEYPDIEISPEIKELNIMNFLNDNQPIVYADWYTIKTALHYLRGCYPLKSDPNLLIHYILYLAENEMPHIFAE